MNVNIEEWIWLNGEEVCPARYLTEVSGLSNEELDDLIDNGIIVPIDAETQPGSFRMQHVVTAILARRLRDDFELDRHGVALAMTLLRRVDELEAELTTAQARLSRMNRTEGWS
jgi:chaperone modulatory protein CbpM